MPSIREKQEVAAIMMDRFGLPGFEYGVDSMVEVINAKPQSIVPGTPAQTYWTRDINNPHTQVIYCIYNAKINM